MRNNDAASLESQAEDESRENQHNYNRTLKTNGLKPSSNTNWIKTTRFCQIERLINWLQS